MTRKKRHLHTESLSLWYQALLNRYDYVAGSNNAIDSKSGVLLAANIAVLAISAPNVINHPSFLGVIGSIGLLISTAIAALSIHVRDARESVVTSQDRIDYYYMKDHKFVWQLIADVEDATAHNKNINTSKARQYYWLVYTFLVSSIVLLLSNFITITLVSS